MSPRCVSSVAPLTGNRSAAAELHGPDEQKISDPATTSLAAEDAA